MALRRSPSDPSRGRRRVAQRPRNRPPSPGPPQQAASAARRVRPATATSLSGLTYLVTRFVQAHGDIETRAVSVHHATSKKEMEITKIRLSTKKRQYMVIESMLMQGLEAAKHAIRTLKLCMSAGS